MKRVLTYLYCGVVAIVVAIGASSCRNKELYDLPPSDPTAKPVTVRINWAEGLPVPTANGMRINLFSLSPDFPHYGKADVSAQGGVVRLMPYASYRTIAYNYADNNLKFLNENDPERFEAVSTELTRSTYSRAYPDEKTVDQVLGDFHVGINPGYTVLDTDEAQYIDIYPTDRVKTYTFEIRGVEGAQYITQSRGAISGFSASYFLNTEKLAETPSTLLFNAQANGDDETITGSFRTFGRLDAMNNFTIEILYPTRTKEDGGITQQTWDVTSQIDNGTNYHILIINDPSHDIPPIPDPGIPDGGGSGFKVDVDEWENVIVPLN